MIDIMKLSHKELIAVQHIAFENRWQNLGRDRLPYAKEFILSKFGPEFTTSNKGAAEGVIV